MKGTKEEIIQQLINIGFTEEQAILLIIGKTILNYKSETLKSNIHTASETYEVTESEIRKLIVKHSGFAGYDHLRVLEYAKEVYGEENKEAIIKTIFKFPPSAGLNHSRVLSQAKKVYGEENENAIIKTILKHPPFVGYNHSRVLEQAKKVYGEQNEKAIIKCILKQSSFTGLDHSRVLKKAKIIYGEENEKIIIKAILKFPPFAGLNHSRVLKQKNRIGRIIGLTKTEVINILLNNPTLSSYSVKRDLAVLNIMRTLALETQLPTDKVMVKMWLNNCTKSPYVPNHNRKRISQVQNYTEPKLMAIMRKKISNLK